jgi:serine/threonine protein kinase/WD40 repeat protein
MTDRSRIACVGKCQWPRLCASPNCDRFQLALGSAADQNAITRTGAPGAGAAEVTKSSDDDSHGAESGQVGRSPPARLPAPLQYRDSDRYEVLAEHGRGGLGRVLRARDRELGRSVAIKELLAPTTSSELRFFREALITARLEHPGIVPVHEAGRWHDGTPFYAMKLVAGQPLSALLATSQGLEQRLALVPHVLAVADAIAYAHSRAIIHRDLKPSNVIVGEFGETVVIDWGLAKDLKESQADEVKPDTTHVSTSSVTVAGSVLGTPAFMSPEQARGEEASTASDVYGLGAILLKVLTDRTPSEPDWPTRVRASRRTRELASIVGRALAARPEARYPDAAAFGDDLRRYIRGAEVRAHRYTPSQRIARFLRSHRTLSVSISLTVATAAVVFALFAGELVRERERTLATNNQLQRAVQALQEEQQSLVLQQVRANVDRDPTTAIAWLKKYSGSERPAAQQLGATAISNGVAAHAFRPPGSTISHVAVVSMEPLLVALAQVDGTLLLWQSWDAVTTLSRELDARVLVVADAEKRLLVFGTRSGKLVAYRHDTKTVAEIASYQPPLRALQMFDDDERILAVSAMGEVLIATADATAVRRLSAGHRIHAAMMSPTGRFLFFCTADGRAELRTVDTWTSRRLGRCSKQATAPYAFSSDELSIAVSTDVSVDLYETSTGRRQRTVVVRAASHLVAARGGGLLIGSVGDGLLTVGWTAGEPRQLLKTTTRPTAMYPSGRRVVVGFEDGQVMLFEHDRLSWVQQGLHQRITDMAVFPGGNGAVVVDGREMRVHAWPLFRAWPVDTTATFNVGYSESRRQLAADSEDGSIFFIDLDSDAIVAKRDHGATTFGIKVLDGAFLSASWDGTVRMWGRAHESTVVAKGEGIARHFATDAGRLLTIYTDNAVTLGDLSGPERSRRWSLPETPYRAAAGHGVFVVGSLGGGVYEVDDAGVRAVGRHSDTVTAVSFVPALDVFVTTGLDGIVRLWGGQPELQEVGQVKAGARCRSMTTASFVVAVTCDRMSVRVFDLRTHEELFHRELEQEHYDAALSPSGTLLAVTTSSGKVFVWNLTTEALAVVSVGTSLVSSVTFSDDESRFFATTFSNRVFAWDVFRMRFLPLEVAASLGELSDAVVRDRAN